MRTNLLSPSLLLAAAFVTWAPAAHAQTYASTHPDQYFRSVGTRYLDEERYGDALRVFRIAARHGDKFSQLQLGHLYWTGRGVAQDRATAYAWFDLAAERGYPKFLELRERAWAALGERERARALDIGASLYGEYGDDIAKPRLERKLARGRRSAMAGDVPRGWVYLFCAGDYFCGRSNATKVNASAFYDDRHWRADPYWAWQDSAWMPQPTGEVEVGPLRRDPSAPLVGPD